MRKFEGILPNESKKSFKERSLIPKSELKHDVWYRGSCRNSSKARWDSENNRFRYLRTKFGDSFWEDINHPEDDNGFDLFYPFEEITNGL